MPSMTAAIARIMILHCWDDRDYYAIMATILICLMPRRQPMPITHDIPSRHEHILLHTQKPYTKRATILTFLQKVTLY